MVACHDFQLDMLLWAVKQAQQYQLSNVSRVCLNQLVVLAKQEPVLDGSEYLALLR